MTLRQTLKAIKPIYLAYHASRYAAFRCQLAVTHLHDKLDSAPTNGYIVPPARLRHRVHGSLDKASFLRVGALAAQNIREICQLAGTNIFAFNHILDFGCGCGRVMQNFRDAPATCHLYGTDIDRALIAWCQQYLTFAEWNNNAALPPLPYPDQHFDLIYAISVFTHLDEALQFQWLAELQRVAKPGALIILSIHGAHIIGTLPAAYQEDIRQRGFCFESGVRGTLKLDGLPDFYQTTYHTRDYIEQHWSRYFDIQHYVERAINQHQDAVVLRKRD